MQFLLQDTYTDTLTSLKSFIPLRVIQNASKWLEEDLEPHQTTETLERMSLLRLHVLRMERLLDDLLEYSRIGRASIGND